MPTRIIREGIITSEAINRLSDEAELFYRRLMSIADDYGRYYSHPSILRANCYPLKLETVSESDVKQWLSECVSNGVISFYGEGQKYIQIHKFGQQTRSKSKFPEPDKQTLIKCKSNDNQMSSLVGVGDVVGDEGVVATEIEKRLSEMFGRKNGEKLSYMELSAIVEISRRPNARNELGIIESYHEKEQRFFPRSMSSLVSRWQEVLDQARTYKPNRTPQEERQLKNWLNQL